MWKGQSSRIPTYLDLKKQSNQDFREQKDTSQAPSIKPRDHLIQDVRLQAQREKTNKENQPTNENDRSKFEYADVRYRQNKISQNSGKLPSKETRKHSQDKTAPFYNPGRPRTYLSDRETRNIDIRELSSRSRNSATIGYQYPTPQQQSAGPPKKVPGNFIPSKPPTPAPKPSKYLLISLYGHLSTSGHNFP